MKDSKAAMHVLWQDVLPHDNRDINTIKTTSYVSSGSSHQAQAQGDRNIYGPNLVYNPARAVIKYRLVLPEGRVVVVTAREFHTLSLIVDGYTVASAARHMNLSARTVEYYVKSLRDKCECATKRALITWVKQHRLLEHFEKVISTSGV